MMKNKFFSWRKIFIGFVEDDYQNNLDDPYDSKLNTLEELPEQESQEVFPMNIANESKPKKI